MPWVLTSKNHNSFNSIAQLCQCYLKIRKRCSLSVVSSFAFFLYLQFYSYYSTLLLLTSYQLVVVREMVVSRTKLPVGKIGRVCGKF